MKAIVDKRNELNADGLKAALADNPAEDLRERPPARTMSPLASTTSSCSTLSMPGPSDGENAESPPPMSQPPAEPRGSAGPREQAASRGPENRH